MKKLLSTVILFVIFTHPLFASRLYTQPYEVIAQDVKTILIIKVDEVESLERYRHFKNAEKKLIATTTIVYGTVVEQVFGKFNEEKIITKFTSVVPMRYSEDGKVLATKSVQRCISGQEHLPKIGEMYIFSYESLDNNRENVHLRMDLLEDKSKIMEIVQKKKATNVMNTDSSPVDIQNEPYDFPGAPIVKTEKYGSFSVLELGDSFCGTISQERQIQFDCGGLAGLYANEESGKRHGRCVISDNYNTRLTTIRIPVQGIVRLSRFHKGGNRDGHGQTGEEVIVVDQKGKNVRSGCR